MSGLSLSETAQLAQFALSLDPNPVRLGARMLGLDAEEQSQVPRWAWYVLGAGVVGAAAAVIGRSYFLRRAAEGE